MAGNIAKLLNSAGPDPPGLYPAPARSAGLARCSLDDDVFKLARIGQSAESIDGELEWLIFGHRRSAELAGDNLDVLALDGG